MADVKQYVNIDPAQADQRKELPKKQAGRRVVLEATVKPKKKGVLVYFEMKSTANNIVKSLEAANFSADKLKHLKGRVGGLPGTSIRCARTDAKGVARLTIKLSEFGGDEFETQAYIFGKKKKKKPLTADKYIVWRRIYYQVSRFKSGPKGAGRTGTLPAIPKLDWAKVKTEYEARQHNLELLDETSTDLITRRANVVNPDEDEVLKKSAREGYDGKREPLALRVVLVNQIASSVEDDYERIVKVSENTPATFTTRRRLWVDESMPRTEDWAVAAEWRRDASDSWKTLDRKYLRRTGAKTFVINFQEIPKQGFFDWFRKAQVQMTLRYLDGSTNGLSWYNAIWLAAENMHEGARTEDAKQQTTIHEVGHGIGMVPPGQSTHYIEHGHTGGHCSTGLSAVQKTKAKYWGLPGTCVMFGENATTRKAEFCTDCDKSVRTRKIVLDEMPADWVL
jgi:hypothetical protein